VAGGQFDAQASVEDFDRDRGTWNRHYVRVIEDGAVRIKGFHSQAAARAFAQGEQARLTLDASLKK